MRLVRPGGDTEVFSTVRESCLQALRVWRHRLQSHQREI